LYEKFFFTISATVLCLALVAAAEIQPVIDTVVTGQQGSGCIDWNCPHHLFTGIGAPNMDVTEAARRPGAIRAAQQVALRNALETLKGIFLNSSTTVENFMMKKRRYHEPCQRICPRLRTEGKGKIHERRVRGSDHVHPS